MTTNNKWDGTYSSVDNSRVVEDVICRGSAPLFIRNIASATRPCLTALDNS